MARTIELSADPGGTPEEEAALVARVAAAIVETTGDEVEIQLTPSERVQVPGTGVAERMQGSARWSA